MSIARYFWILAIYLLFTPAFATPQVSAEDRAALTHCLARDKSGEKCIGIVSQACPVDTQTSDADVVEANIRACAGRELAVWNELLQASLAVVNASGSPAVCTAVAEAQSNWLKSRESVCPIFDNVDPGMYSGGANYCRLQEASRRALILGCLSSSHDKKDYGETCIEIVAGPCKLRKSEGPKACAARNLADSTKSLQATLKGLKIHASLDADMQSNWLKSREGLCSLFDIVGSDDCRLVETRVHAEILERLLEAVSEH